MNNINSLIIEGEVKNLNYNDYCADFQVEVKRFYRNAYGKNVEEISIFDCEAWGSVKNGIVHLFCNRKENYKVHARLVGRLRQYRNKDQSKVSIICEHIEARYIV